MVQFPRAIDVFLPLLDGFSAITQADLQVFQDALRKIEEVLGAEPSTAAGGNRGPKGGNTSVAARLNKFLELDGGLVDIALVTGTKRLEEFSEDNAGAFIPFGKQLSSASFGLDGYAVLFDATTAGTEDDGNGTQRYLAASAAVWWVNDRRQDGVYLRARDMAGTKITKADARTIDYSCLAVGPGAFYP